MGSYLSTFSPSSSTTAAAMNDYSGCISKIMVIASDGSLHVYTARLTAADALAGGVGAICNADNIVFDAFPPIMPPETELEIGKLYFILAAAELGQRVTGADMAAMAMKASMALRRAEKKQGRRIWRPRVMPVAGFSDGVIANGEVVVEEKMGYLKRTGGRLRRVLSTVLEFDEE